MRGSGLLSAARRPLPRQLPGLPADGPPCYTGTTHADVAQLVEHDLAKVGVAGSSPVVRSKTSSRFIVEPIHVWFHHATRVYQPVLEPVG